MNHQTLTIQENKLFYKLFFMVFKFLNLENMSIKYFYVVRVYYDQSLSNTSLKDVWISTECEEAITLASRLNRQCQ